ncbi:MAG: hypothetical protein ACKOE6_09570, partial [Flammeovirgaceae bacterium]
DEKNVIVNILPEIKAKFNNPDVFMCKGRGSDFLEVEIDGQAPFNFAYDVDDGTTVTTKTETRVGNVRLLKISGLLASTTYQLKSVQDAKGCVVTSFTPPTDKTTVTIGDVDATLIPPASPACNPFTAAFTYNQVREVTPGEGPFYTWQWGDDAPDILKQTFATTVAGQSITHVYNNTSPTSIKAFNARLTVELNARFPFEGCAKRTTATVSVYPFITPDFDLDLPKICSGEQVRVINSSLGVTSYRWYWRNVGSSAQNDIQTINSPSFVITNSGPLNPQPVEVWLESNNGNCTAAAISRTIDVFKRATADFTISPGPYTLNSNIAQVDFTNASNPLLDLTNFTYDWTFGNIGDVTPQSLNQTTGGSVPIPVQYTSSGLKSIT